MGSRIPEKDTFAILSGSPTAFFGFGFYYGKTLVKLRSGEARFFLK